METLLALLVGLLVAVAVYLMLSRRLVRVVLGFILLSNAANLVIFVAGRLTRGAAPLIEHGHETPAGPVANPLPQALILTAIVISFGLLAFTLALLYRTQKNAGTLRTDDL